MGSKIKILVLAQDLTDPAIARRIVMLKAGGADVVVAGFRRGHEKASSLEGCPVLHLGQTYNRAFLQRLMAILRAIVFLNHGVRFFSGTDVIFARNLEMLAIATRVQSFITPPPRIAYEMLDIHRLLLAKNFVGGIMRAVEKRLLRNCAGLLTSSPAFVKNYFQKIQNIELPVRLIENKLFDINHTFSPVNKRSLSPPWKIGWFGILRCRKSLHILRNLTLQNPGKIEVIIRGRPALDAINDFHEIVEATPGLCYLGAYKNPDDLESVYGEVHFTWAIDMFEEGQNSSWLLPNRVYEGSFYGTVPLAIEGLETGAFIKNLNIGVCLPQPLETQLNAFFAILTPHSYQSLASAVRNVPRSVWVYDQKDCEDLVDWLLKLRPSPRQVAHA